MGKQKKPGQSQDRDRTPEQAPERATPELDPLLAEQDALGNQAVQSHLGGEQISEPQVGLDVVRDVALPGVERGLLALELGPVEQGRHERFVEILEASHLPDKQVLIDELRTDRAMVDAVDEAVARWFGDAGRSDVSRVLDATWTALRDDTSITTSDAVQTGSLADRAGALIAEVAEQKAPAGPAREGARGGVGAAVRGLLQDLVLAIAFDEEEEEEAQPGWEMAVEEG